MPTAYIIPTRMPHRCPRNDALGLIILIAMSSTQHRYLVGTLSPKYVEYALLP